MKAVAKTANQLAGIVKSRLPDLRTTGKVAHLRSVREDGKDGVEAVWNHNRFRIDLTLQVRERNFCNSLVETPAAIQLGKILRAKKSKASVAEIRLDSPDVRCDSHMVR